MALEPLQGRNGLLRLLRVFSLLVSLAPLVYLVVRVVPVRSTLQGLAHFTDPATPAGRALYDDRGSASHA
jgi:hypothetical protein